MAERIRNNPVQVYFSDEGYDQVVFYSNLLGFVSPFDSSMLERYAALTGSEVKNGAIPEGLKRGYALDPEHPHLNI